MGRVNWSQAVAEVALLLIGIALAVGVDSCQGAAEQAAVEEAYLESLRNDFQEATTQLEVVATFLASQLEHNQSFLEILSQPVASVGPDSLSRLVRLSFGMSTARPEIATYRDLVSSGNLGILTSDSLRAALARFEISLNALGAIQRVAMDQWATSQSNYFIENLNVTAIYGRESGFEIGSVSIAGLSHTPLVPHLDVDADAFWSREFVNLLAVRNLTLTDEHRYVEIILNQASEITERIEELIGS